MEDGEEGVNMGGFEDGIFREQICIHCRYSE